MKSPQAIPTTIVKMLPRQKARLRLTRLTLTLSWKVDADASEIQFKGLQLMLLYLPSSLAAAGLPTTSTFEAAFEKSMKPLEPIFKILNA